MAKPQLVIVESPTKASKIQDYLGTSFVVKSSSGHIADLPSSSKDGQTRFGIEIANNFKPNYTVIPGKQKIINDLKKQAAAASRVILATDEDREGEAIAWHLCHYLDLDPKTTQRIVYREITSPAIKAALKQPRLVDQNLVDAQQARRVLDRLVGFELSEVLWKKVKHGLSAGRVQSVTVQLLLEKEQTISSFEPEHFYKPQAQFKVAGQDQLLKAELNHKISDPARVQDYLAGLGSLKFKVLSSQSKPAWRRPGPPFKTSSLQQEAANRLGYSPKRTMRLAQVLYENGHITYMRTDSLNLSRDFINQTAGYIKARPDLGTEYSNPQQFNQKQKSAQEAHEAIRPVAIDLEQPNKLPEAISLYKLIRQRSLASQMAPARLLNSTIEIGSGDKDQSRYIASGSQIEFDGFLKIAGADLKEVILPQVAVGDQVSLMAVEAPEKLTRPPARYTEASLIGQLEDLGIGRPSTYAPTITTILDRGYAIKADQPGRQIKTANFRWLAGKIESYQGQETIGAAKAKLLTTDLGRLVTVFLQNHFKTIMDYRFTSRIETQFDQIARGQLKWQNQVGDFYDQLKPLLTSVAKIDKSEVNPARLLGTDPKDKEPIYARLGRFGPMLQKGETETGNKPRFAPLPAGSSLESVDLAAALKMFQLPRDLGLDPAGNSVWVKRGPYGVYIEAGPVRAPVKDKQLDPTRIGLDQALAILADLAEAKSKKVLKQFNDKIQALDGPYGPYLTDGQKNARIPKDTDPAGLSLSQARQLLSQARPGKRSRRPAGKTGRRSGPASTA